MRGARDAQRVAEIVEIVLVRRPGRVDPGSPVSAEHASVAQTRETSLIAELSVVEVFRVELPVALLGQKADFVFQLQTAFAHVPRRKGQVGLRGDIPVPGYR